MFRKLKEWLCKHDWDVAYDFPLGRVMVCKNCDKYHVVKDHWR